MKTQDVVIGHGPEISGVEYRKGSQYHRTDGPAVIRIFSNRTYEELWYQNGILTRRDGPARVKILPDGTTIQEFWIDGRPERADGKAPCREIRPDGSMHESMNPRSTTAVVALERSPVLSAAQRRRAAARKGDTR